MEGLHLFPDLIQQGYWMIKMDLKDATYKCQSMKFINVSPVRQGRETLQIPVPSIWPIISTKGVYKAPETSGGPCLTNWHRLDNLSGQHALYACKQGATGGPGTNDSEPLRSFRYYGEQSKITFNTSSVDRVPRASNQLMQSKALLTPAKGQEDTRCK